MSNRFVAFYTKIAQLNVENLFVRKRERGPKRRIFVNQDLPQDYWDSKGRIKPEYKYTANQVITSKYTWVSFLPRIIFEQSRRIANMLVSR